MKTSSIALRVADFLKGHPPFDGMDAADLQRLAGLGRVKFHESGEYIFRQGEARGPWLYVVQQGTVRIVQNTARGEELVDMRGEGDMLGISWFLSQNTFVHSARTDTDTLLYALPWDEFVPLVRKYPSVSRYLAAYFSLRPNYQLPDPRSGAPPDAPGSATEAPDWWLAPSAPLAERARGHLLTCAPSLSVREAAKKLADVWQDALVVADGAGRPLGIVTDSDLSRRVATGEVPLDAPVEALMSKPVMTVPPGLSAGEIVLLMLRNKVRHLVVTNDGTPGSPAAGLIAERDVHLLHGKLQIALGLEIQAARDTEALRALRARGEELLREALSERAPLTWASEFISEVDAQIVSRLIGLAEDELDAAGFASPRVEYCWLALGTEARKERFLRGFQETALVYADPPNDKKQAVAEWCQRLAARVSEHLAEMGFRPHPDGLSAAQPAFCRSLSEWRVAFSAWIEHPVQENILARLPVFDLRPVAGTKRLGEELRAHMTDEISRHPRFIPLAANDSLANLPPLTIFKDSVVDKEGLLWTCIDTRQHALQPLVDTARVFALETPGEDPLNTSSRFLQAAKRWPEQRGLFEDAAEAVRVTLYHQALTGFRRGDDGQFIRPSELGKIDQEILKGVFRTIVQVIEFTSRHFVVETSVAQTTADVPSEEEAATVL